MERLFVFCLLLVAACGGETPEEPPPELECTSVLSADIRVSGCNSSGCWATLDCNRAPLPTDYLGPAVKCANQNPWPVLLQVVRPMTTIHRPIPQHAPCFGLGCPGCSGSGREGAVFVGTLRVGTYFRAVSGEEYRVVRHTNNTVIAEGADGATEFAARAAGIPLEAHHG